jgi:hypothetical protein
MTQKTKYMVMFSHQNTGQDHNLLIANKSSENVASFNYLGTKITIKMAFTKKLRSDLIQEMLANILFIIFCLPIPSLKT